MRNLSNSTRLAAALAASAALLAGCGGEKDQTAQAQAAAQAVATVSAPAPAAATPQATGFDVTNCLTQQVAPGVRVADLVIPDTIKIDLSKPAGFPNGRRLTDPVIDVTLAVLFLDLTKHPATLFASIPVNPAANDRPFRAEFPYLAPPQGNPPIASGQGSNFAFRSAARSAFVRVDRTGMPAVSTALVTGNPAKDRFNDDSPADDPKWASEFASTLTGLTNALADDFTALGLSLCARPT